MSCCFSYFLRRVGYETTATTTRAHLHIILFRPFKSFTCFKVFAIDVYGLGNKTNFRSRFLGGGSRFVTTGLSSVFQKKTTLIIPFYFKRILDARAHKWHVSFNTLSQPSRLT